MAQQDRAERPGAVVVVAADADGRVLRVAPHPVGRSLVELPACLLADGEDPRAAARRALSEQAGLRADTWHPLGVDLLAVPAGAVSSQVFHARDLHPAPESPQHPVSQRRWVALDPADDMIDLILRSFATPPATTGDSPGT